MSDGTASRIKAISNRYCNPDKNFGDPKTTENDYNTENDESFLYHFENDNLNSGNK